LRERMLAGCIRPYSPWWTRGGPAQRRAHAGRRTEIARTGTTPAERRHARRSRQGRPRRLCIMGAYGACPSAPVSGSWPGSVGCAMAWPCRSPSSRSAAADGEDRSMAQTDQAWDWGVELRDEERSELELLRRTVAQLRTQLDQAHDSLKTCRQRQQDASQALRQLDEVRPWRRRRVRKALRDRQLL
jgi:hypothetical protein